MKVASSVLVGAGRSGVDPVRNFACTGLVSWTWAWMSHRAVSRLAPGGTSTDTGRPQQALWCQSGHQPISIPATVSPRTCSRAESPSRTMARLVPRRPITTTCSPGCSLPERTSIEETGTSSGPTRSAYELDALVR